MLLPLHIYIPYCIILLIHIDVYLSFYYLYDIQQIHLYSKLLICRYEWHVQKRILRIELQQNYGI